MKDCSGGTAHICVYLICHNPVALTEEDPVPSNTYFLYTEDMDNFRDTDLEKFMQS